jgi:hypothetical protein
VPNRLRRSASTWQKASFDATVWTPGISLYLRKATVEQQQIAAHQSPRTTKLDDRTKNEISLDEVERIKF